MNDQLELALAGFTERGFTPKEVLVIQQLVQSPLYRAMVEVAHEKLLAGRANLVPVLAYHFLAGVDFGRARAESATLEELLR